MKRVVVTDGSSPTNAVPDPIFGETTNPPVAEELPTSLDQNNHKQTTPRNNYTQSLNWFLEFVGDDTLAGDFLQFQKTDFNIFLALFCSAICVIYFVVHICYQTFWIRDNPSYIVAFAAGLLTTFTATYLLAIRVAATLSPDTFAKWKPLHVVHTRLLSIDQSSVRWIYANNVFVLAFSTSSSLFMLARVYEGFCDPNVSKTWQQQQNCNGAPVRIFPLIADAPSPPTPSPRIISHSALNRRRRGWPTI